jgi:hypothetical protein
MGGLTDVIESKILPVVSEAAPLLGSVLGTPLAGVAISLIAKAFGVNPDDLNALSSALINDPETSIKLKTLEYDHAETLSKIAASNYSTEVDDRKNARGYGVLYKDFLKHLACFVTVGFFLALFLLFLPLNINAEEKNLLSMLVGMLASKWQTIIDFFYGSSRHNQGAIK